MCAKAVSVDTGLHIRHGSALLIRSLEWLVTEQHVPEQLIGWPIQEALGSNTRELLAAAADRFAGSADVEKLLSATEDNTDGRLSGLREGVNHGDGDNSVSSSGTETENWYEIGEEIDKEWKNV